jgi:hypothetical protein
MGQMPQPPKGPAQMNSVEAEGQIDFSEAHPENAFSSIIRRREPDSKVTRLTEGEQKFPIPAIVKQNERRTSRQAGKQTDLRQRKLPKKCGGSSVIGNPGSAGTISTSEPSGNESAEKSASVPAIMMALPGGSPDAFQDSILTRFRSLYRS